MGILLISAQAERGKFILRLKPEAIHKKDKGYLLWLKLEAIHKKDKGYLLWLKLEAIRKDE